MNLGERIAEQRIKMGYSQVELGNHLNVTYQTIASWEAGESTPSIETMIQLSKVLNASLDYLMKGKNTDALSNAVGVEEIKPIESEDRGKALQNGTASKIPSKTKSQKSTKTVTTIAVFTICLVAIVACFVVVLLNWDRVKQVFIKTMPNNIVASERPEKRTDSQESDSKSIESIAESVLYLELFDEDSQLIGTASGFLIDDGMTIVTNYHVIEEAYSIVARPKEGKLRTRCNTILAYDIGADLAVLRCDSYLNVEPLTLGNAHLVSQGDNVYAIGYPLGVANTLSDGIVSSVYEDDFGVDVIQITAPISGGSSGGPVVNTDGEVIGVICAYYERAQNLNISISVSELKTLLMTMDEANAVTLEEYHAEKLSYLVEVMSWCDSEDSAIPVTLEDLFYYPEYYDGQLIALSAWNAFSVDTRGPDSVHDFIEAVLINDKSYFLGNKQVISGVDNDEIGIVALIRYISKHIIDNNVPHVVIKIHDQYITDSNILRETEMTVLGRFTYDTSGVSPYQMEVYKYSLGN